MSFEKILLETLQTSKKTFYYNFFPTKEEEESLKSTRLHLINQLPGIDRRVLVEIRDVYPPPVANPDNPWRIKKTLSRKEIDAGKFFLSWNDAFEHVLRYWSLGTANLIALGSRVSVGVWDVTQEEYPRKYENDGDAYLQMVGRDKFALVCAGLIKDRNLKVHTDIGLYWDSKKYVFRFKFLVA